MSDKAFALLVGLIFGGFIAGVIGFSFTQRYYRVKAITHGVAHWECDLCGRPEFVWDEPAKSEASAVR